MKVRDELSGETFEALDVRWSSSLPRDSPKPRGQVYTFGWRSRMTDLHKAWAKPRDPLDDMWRPVEVVL